MLSHSESESFKSRSLESTCNGVNKIDTLHQRFGHPSVQILNDILMSCDVSSNINKISVRQFCATCQYGKVIN